MMKTSKVELLMWLPEQDENIEINWPKLHKTIGVDHTNWLLKQPNNHCQLVLERNDKHCRLIAEFYTDQALAEYHLMWAK
jgi:hypothetical protein